MAKSRKSRKSIKRRMSKKGRKGSRRRMRGGVAPVGYGVTSAGEINLAQGRQFDEAHVQQHGGALAYGDYPGAIGATLPSDMTASAKLTALNQSFDYIKQFGPSSDNPNLSGGRRRKAKKTRKSRKSKRHSRKQRGGFLNSMKQQAMNYAVQQGAIAKQQAMNYAKQQGAIAKQQAMNYAVQQAQMGLNRLKQKTVSTRRNKQHGGLYRWGGGSRRQLGGSYAEMRFPMSVADEGKMLIPLSLEAQAGLNKEWALAKDPMAFAPKM